MATLPPFSTSTIPHMSHDILRESTSISSLSDRDPAYLQDIFVSWLRKDQTNSYIPQTSCSNSSHFSFKNCSSAMLIDPSKHPVVFDTHYFRLFRQFQVLFFSHDLRPTKAWFLYSYHSTVYLSKPETNHPTVFFFR